MARAQEGVFIMSANLSAITSVFELATDDFSPYDRVVLIYLRTLSLEHSSVFPSYETIASKCGMVRRTVINVIKRLIKHGLIAKESRFKDVPGTDRPRQTSNEYITTTAPAVSSNSPVVTDELPPSNSLYNSNSFKHKQEEDENINIAPNPPYLPFENEIKRNKITPEIRIAILEQVAASGADIWHYSAEAIRRALKKATNRMRLGSGLYNPPKWIAAALRNEQMNLDIAGA
jgi:DNA-binding transcriptional MocR family regulator